MQRTQATPQTLELFASQGWAPHAASSPMRIAASGRAALDAAHARGYDTDDLVRGPDATLVLTLGTAGGPARMEGRRLVVDLDARDAVETTREWLAKVAPRTLGICGPRRRRAGAYGRAYAFLSRVLAKGHA